MPPIRHLLIAPVGALAITLAGCGITNPYTTARLTSPTGNSQTISTTTTIAPSPGSDADQTPGPASVPARDTGSARSAVAADAGQPTPQAALKRYARLYVNWTARTVAAVQRRLAAISLAGARAQALQAAASYQRDSTLLASRVTNSGTVIAIAPNQPTPDQWVIVTREQTTGTGDYTGLPPTLHVTYAQLTHTPSGFVVNEWAPQT